MFDVKAEAEIKHINLRKETHGDELVPATDIKMTLVGVPVDRISSACPDISKRFYEGELVAVGEINPLTVQHKLENLRVKIGSIGLVGADIKKGAKINLQPRHVANVEVSVQISDITAGQLEELTDLYVEGKATIEINERQLDVLENTA